MWILNPCNKRVWIVNHQRMTSVDDAQRQCRRHCPTDAVGAITPHSQCGVQDARKYQRADSTLYIVPTIIQKYYLRKLTIICGHSRF